MHKITTPVEGFNGIVAGVHFRDGQGQTDDDGAVAYFRRHRYGVEPIDQPTVNPEASPEQPERPARGDSKAKWATYAVSPDGGMTADAAEALTRDQLAEKYLGPKEA
ncbi:hypothetical protein [Micromonospora sp. RTGN7]|uniref:hypothetical protein n=1 Tax=Micromonospora sp. RTGN7 TaxID=3016526 RepID=UPI0029FF3F14|nr:hypothetical protein [Micromonospora sp. RTGN7]